MKTIKQLQALELLKHPKYKVIGGDLYSIKRGEWRVMSGTSLPTGYVQYSLCNHRRGAHHISIRVYKHIAIYLATNGVYKEGYEIDHIDRDKSNTHPDNLRAVPRQVNIENRGERVGSTCDRPIRGKEIDDIRRLLAEGLNQSQIARNLNLNRLSVRYTIKNIEEGKPLKYEGYY